LDFSHFLIIAVKLESFLLMKKVRRSLVAKKQKNYELLPPFRKKPKNGNPLLFGIEEVNRKKSGRIDSRCDQLFIV